MPKAPQLESGRAQTLWGGLIDGPLLAQVLTQRHVQSRDEHPRSLGSLVASTFPSLMPSSSVPGELSTRVWMGLLPWTDSW